MARLLTAVFALAGVADAVVFAVCVVVLLWLAAAVVGRSVPRTNDRDYCFFRPHLLLSCNYFVRA